MERGGGMGEIAGFGGLEIRQKGELSLAMKHTLHTLPSLPDTGRHRKTLSFSEQPENACEPATPDLSDTIPCSLHTR